MGKISEKYPTIIPSSIAIVMLFFALLPLPYGYYTLLRLVVCGSSLFAANKAYVLKKEAWMYISGFIVLLFNPIIPVHLDKGIWILLDIITIVTIGISINQISKDS